MKNSLVSIYSAETEVDAQMIKNLLANYNIKAILENATLGTVVPYMAAGGGAGAVKVLIKQEDEEEAKKIIEENN